MPGKLVLWEAPPTEDEPTPQPPVSSSKSRGEPAPLPPPRTIEEPPVALDATPSEPKSAAPEAADARSPKTAESKAPEPTPNPKAPAEKPATAPKPEPPTSARPSRVDSPAAPETIATPAPTAAPAVPPPPAAAHAAPSSSGIVSAAPQAALHVDNTDVRKVLEILSRQAKVNILTSPGVSGSITLNIEDRSAEDILAIIAKHCNLIVRREKGVFYVSTPAEQYQGEEGDLPTRVYRLNYVKSSDVDSMIRPLLSTRGVLTASPDSEVGIKTDAEKAGGNTMAGGEVVIIQDYEYILRKTDRVIAELDVPPLQVLIEAVIVSVKLEKNMELGVNFALLDGAGKAVGVIGDGAAINAAAGFTPASVLTAGGKLASGFAPADSNGVKFGWVGGSTTGFIEALEKMAETKVLASPRLLVLNKQRAEIQLGDRLGYQTATQTQTSTVQQVQFMDIGTLLRLRPFIHSDGTIRMEIHPERSSGKIDSAGIPQTRSAQVTTNVLIPDGATLVIGGLIESEVTQDWQGLPFLSRIPLLGYVFRHTSDDVTKSELIVILTPHIYRPDVPDALNYLGKPRALGLEKRVGQRPCAEAKDGPSLFELTSPEPCRTEGTP